MLAHPDNVFLAGIIDDLREIFDENHKMIVSPSQGERDDAWRATQAAVSEVKDNCLFASLIVVVKLNVDSRKVQPKKGCRFHGIWGSVVGISGLCVEDEDDILGLGSMGFDSNAIVGLQGLQVCPQEALVTSIW